MEKKPQFEQIYNETNTSFRYGWFIQSYLEEKPLHFHPEFEINYIIKGYGHRMTGNYLEPFYEGELILHPSGLPHCWIYNPDSFLPGELRECIFVQFSVNFIRDGISFFKEWDFVVYRLFSLQQSMKIVGETAEDIILILKKMNKQTESEKLLSLFEIVLLLGETDNLIPIGNHPKLINNITKNMRRIQLVYKYVSEHYKHKIPLTDIANIVSMSCSAFCAFFKKETGKTFNTFINEYRIDIACNLLKIFPEKEINEIAWECGFRDIPYFNRIFKKIKTIPPNRWKRESLTKLQT